MTIDRDLQKQAYDALYAQIKALLIQKITGISAEASSEEGETYSLQDVYCALIDNHFVSVSRIENSEKEYAQEQTVAALKKRGISAYYTADGDVTIVSNGKELKITQ